MAKRTLVLLIFVSFNLNVSISKDLSSLDKDTEDIEKIEENHSLLRKGKVETSPLALVSNRPKTLKPPTKSRLGSIVSRAIGGGRSGATAGFIQVISMMWLRTIMNYQYRYGLSSYEASRRLYTEGGLSRFYKGVSFALIQGPLARFGATAANEGMLGVMSQMHLHHSKAKIVLVSALSSIVAGMWRFFIMPLDTCKTVLQVEGNKGFSVLVSKVKLGQFRFLYSGAYASALATAVGHLPWFSTFNFLNKHLAKQSTFFGELLRNAFIGFSASLVSDLFTNWLRVLKTSMQVSGSALGYGEVLSQLIRESGMKGLAFRGLDTRILANGIQSVIFTVCWRYLMTSSDQNKH